MESIRVFLVDDHQVVLESLAMMISSLNGITVTGTALNGHDAMKQIEGHAVDIVLSDMHMPGISGIELALQLRQQRPEIKLILLTMEEESDMVQEAIAAGVCGYVLKKATKKEVETALLTVANGQTYFSKLLEKEVAPASNASEGFDEVLSDRELLTKREKEIIRLIVNDVSGPEIAEQLFISPKTVETHRRNIFKKLDIHSVVALTRFALKNNLL